MKVSLSWYQVKDLEAAKIFYGETLGLKKIFEMPNWAEFSHDKMAAAIGLSESPEQDSNAGPGAVVVLRVHDLERTKKELSEQGERRHLTDSLLGYLKIDIGRLSPAFPVTPPCIRVRTRRFGELS